MCRLGPGTVHQGPVKVTVKNLYTTESEYAFTYKVSFAKKASLKIFVVVMPKKRFWQCNASNKVSK